MSVPKGLFLYINICVAVFFIHCTELQSQPVHGVMEVNSSLARKLLQESEVLIEMGAYQKALKDLQKAEALFVNERLWAEAVEVAIRLAKLSDHFETTDLKIKYGALALSLAQQHLPKDHHLLASAFRQKAEALMVLQKLDSANYFLAQASPLFQQQQNWSEMGWSEILMGVNHLNQYQLDACQKHFDQVKILLKEQPFSEEDRTDLQSTLLELSGVLYQLQGDYNKAIENIHEALNTQLSKATFSDLDSLFIAEHFNNLGALYLTKGDYIRALDNFQQALNSYKKSATDPTLLYNIGALLLRQKKYSDAIPYFRKCLSLLKDSQENQKQRIDALNGMGVAFRGLKQYKKAMYYCQKAMAIPDDYRKFMTLGVIGSIFILESQAQKAIAHLERALKKCEADSTGYASSSFFVSRLYYFMGNAQVLNGDTSAALQFYQKSLVYNHKYFNNDSNYLLNPSLSGVHKAIYFLETLRAKAKTLAAISRQEPQREAALSTYQLTIQWIDSLQISYVSEASRLDWSSTFKAIYEEAISFAHQSYKATQDFKYLEQAFSFSEKSKNAILLEALKSIEGQALAGIPDTMIQRERTLKLDIVFYEKALQKAKEQKEKGKVSLYQEYLSKMRLELIAIKEKWGRDYPRYRAWKYGGKPASINDIQNKLTDEHTVFIEYFLGDSTAFAFVITRQSSAFLPLAPTPKINTSLAAFRKALLDHQLFKSHTQLALKNYQQSAFTVYQKILKAPLSKLSADIQKIIIAADGALNTIPFEALSKMPKEQRSFDFAALPYLLYDFQFQYTYSANLLLKNQSRGEQLPFSTACLAFAPTYENTSLNTRQGPLNLLRNAEAFLEGTASEVQQISKFVDGQFHFDSTATEQRFKALAHQYGIIHLAMHGAADHENPNFNYLKFSDLGPSKLEDNLLHYYEIATMDLQAQLVVLSACETGVGRYEKGEGVFSLARSFMYAGVPSILMSLWKVNDASTSQLIPYFYENLAKGQTKDLALHQAKLRFLEEANLEYRHPFYWSAFIVMGDARALKKTRPTYVIWGVVLLLIFTGAYLKFQ